MADPPTTSPIQVRPSAPAAVPWSWRIGFGLVVLALVVFAVWSLLLVSHVRTLRAEVEANVSWLQRTSALQRRVTAWIETPPPRGPEWVAAADEIATLADEAAAAERAALAGPLAHARAAIDHARAGPPSPPSDLRDALEALVQELRRDNAERSAALGASWDDLVFVVFMALLLAMLDVLLLALVERRRRQAQRLAAEIVATADELADARAALREREAVARLADELRAARDRAEEASAAKSRFLARVSHELLTPLNIILGYAALVRERCEELAVPGVDGDVGRLEFAANGLFRQIRHILDLTQLDAGDLALTREDVPLAPLLAALVEEARPVAARAGTTLAVQVPDGLRLVCDPGRLTTVVAELLGNACRFTRDGHVELIAAAEAEYVRIEVRDDGPGMSAEDLQRATAPFFQADESPTRRHDGAGLGLTVANRLCARMGGTLALHSRPGQGTTVTLRIPGRAA